MAYGSTISDWKLVKRSLLVEAGSLVFCIVMGAIIGLILGTTQLADNWPTPEMYTRATWSNFLVGLPVAFFSGLGVAVSLLDEQTSSLVGVAISASLLPPAVNAGILWVSFGFYERGILGVSSDTDSVNATVSVNGNQEHTYTHAEFQIGGMISLLLTLANIVLIWVSSMIMFRLKEVSVY
jgi:uncharacterized membrane protein